MKIIPIKSLSDIMNTSPCALALGNFDGVHLAHKTLLDTAIA
ncbi:MAG: bifunctional riboflavin kinase/FAD synthetase, partial [Clostridia bacterium]|nr:bifunctional riboflavin kinase/FAD synthetase [Clostridia bacterium]